MSDKRKYSQRKVIAMDVDGTLLVHGRLNHRLIDWIIKKAGEGFTCYLWSARGEEYAKVFADKHKIKHLFTHIMSKPGIAVDDMGWRWTRDVNTVIPKPKTAGKL